MFGNQQTDGRSGPRVAPLRGLAATHRPAEIAFASGARLARHLAVVVMVEVVAAALLRLLSAPERGSAHRQRVTRDIAFDE